MEATEDDDQKATTTVLADAVYTIKRVYLFRCPARRGWSARMWKSLCLKSVALGVYRRFLILRPQPESSMQLLTTMQ